MLQCHYTKFDRAEDVASGICDPFTFIERLALVFQVFIAMGT